MWFVVVRDVFGTHWHARSSKRRAEEAAARMRRGGKDLTACFRINEVFLDPPVGVVGLLAERRNHG